MDAKFNINERLKLVEEEIAILRNLIPKFEEDKTPQTEQEKLTSLIENNLEVFQELATILHEAEAALELFDDGSWMLIGETHNLTGMYGEVDLPS
jgi:hypothetical protein